MRALAYKGFETSRVPQASRERYSQAFQEYVCAEFLKQR